MQPPEHTGNQKSYFISGFPTIFQLTFHTSVVSEENSWTAISVLLRTRKQDPDFNEDEKPLKLLLKKLSFVY